MWRWSGWRQRLNACPIVLSDHAGRWETAQAAGSKAPNKPKPNLGDARFDGFCMRCDSCHSSSDPCLTCQVQCQVAFLHELHRFTRMCRDTIGTSSERSDRLLAVCLLCLHFQSKQVSLSSFHTSVYTWQRITEGSHQMLWIIVWPTYR